MADAEAGFGGVCSTPFELMKGHDRGRFAAAGALGRPAGVGRRSAATLGGKVLIPTGPAHQDAQRRPAWPPTSAACRPWWWPGPTRTRRRLITSDVDRGATCRSSPGRADRGGLLPHPQRHGRLGRPRARLLPPTPTLPLDGDLPRRTWRRHVSCRRGDQGRVPRPDAPPTTARPSFKLAQATWTTAPSRSFQRELGQMGYKFQFIHACRGSTRLNYSIVRSWPRGYAEEGMPGLRAGCRMPKFGAEGERLQPPRGIISARWGRGYFEPW